jgi:hypothetical protein
MIKSTRYRITLALLIATVAVIGNSFPLSAVTAGCEGASSSIPVKTKMGKLTYPAAGNDLFVQESSAKEPLLRMAQIRTTSSRGLKLLRGMHLDIVRVRADYDRAQGKDLFSYGYVVEAVVTKGELAKLKKMGFQVSEIHEKN